MDKFWSAIQSILEENEYEDHLKNSHNGAVLFNSSYDDDTIKIVLTIAAMWGVNLDDKESERMLLWIKKNKTSDNFEYDCKRILKQGPGAFVFSMSPDIFTASMKTFEFRDIFDAHDTYCAKCDKNEIIQLTNFLMQHYESKIPDKNEKYGEILPEEIINHICPIITPLSKFVEIGSGYNILITVVSKNCRCQCIGFEINKERQTLGDKVLKEYNATNVKTFNNIGPILNLPIDTTIIYTNNVAFDQNTKELILEVILRCCPNTEYIITTCQILSSRCRYNPYLEFEIIFSLLKTVTVKASWNNIDIFIYKRNKDPMKVS